MKYEYKTTTAHNHIRGGQEAVDSPSPPGDEWELCGVSANETTRFHEWRRPIPETKSKK